MKKQKDLDKQENEEFKRALSRHIKMKREAAGLTAAEFGRRINMERSHVAKLEGGTVNITVVTVKAICKGLNLSFSELFEGFDY